MPKDFAGRGRSTSVKQSTRKQTKRKPRKRVSPAQRVLFHGPSFAMGALVGAAIVVLAAYGPELMDLQELPTAAPAKPPEEGKSLIYTFQDELKNTVVEPDPVPYAVPEDKRASAQHVYSIQAASFRSKVDADQLRARLILENLPARTSASTVNGSTWYRVVVGPFDSKLAADRAMTHLREQGLGAIRVNDHN